MSSELIQTGFFDLEDVRNAEPIQVIYDYSRVTPEQADQLQTIYDRMFVRHFRTAYEDGKDLLEAKQVKNLPYSEFIEWTQACYGWGQTVVERKINRALYWGDFSPASGAKIDEKAIEVISTKRVPETVRQEAKALLTAGENIDEERAKQLRDAEKARKDAEKKAEEKERELALFKQEVESNEQAYTALVQSLEQQLEQKPEVIDHREKELEGKIQAKEIEREKLEREQERLRIEARQRLDEDLEKQRQEQKLKLKETEKELKASYAQKEQDLQLKAENTIRSLLSHGIKSMAETQLTIEHAVSAGMLQAVQQLGGRQVYSFLAQAESLQEELDRVIAKLTQGDYVTLPERIA